MNTFKIGFDNGDSLTTGFNGTIKDAENYYIGTYFNLGNADRDIMTKGVKVEEV